MLSDAPCGVKYVVPETACYTKHNNSRKNYKTDILYEGINVDVDSLTLENRKELLPPINQPYTCKHKFYRGRMQSFIKYIF